MLGFRSAARERKGLKACDALDLAMWGCDIHLAFGCCRAAAMTSTWQHSEHSSSAHLAGLPALATAAAAAEEVPEGPSDQPEPSDQQQHGKGGVQAQRVDSNAQSDPIEPQPTPFEAFTQAPLSSEKPEAGAAKAKIQVPDIMSSMESSAMGMSTLSATHTHVDRNRSVSIRSGGTGSMQVVVYPLAFSHVP